MPSITQNLFLVRAKYSNHKTSIYNLFSYIGISINPRSLSFEIFDVMKMMRFLPLLAMISCGPKYDTKYYKAISLDKRDTAILKLQTSDEARAFYGDYQVKYDDKTMDDGTIKGHIKGDTLIGNFRFLSRNNVKSIEPVAFLRNNEQLKLGAGIAGTFMGFQVYKGGSISFNDSSFQFKPIELEDLISTKKTVK